MTLSLEDDLYEPWYVVRLDLKGEVFHVVVTQNLVICSLIFKGFNIIIKIFLQN